MIVVEAGECYQMWYVINDILSQSSCVYNISQILEMRVKCYQKINLIISTVIQRERTNL